MCSQKKEINIYADYLNVLSKEINKYLC